MFNVLKDSQEEVKARIFEDFILCQDKIQSTRNESLNNTSKKRYKTIYKDISNAYILYYYTYDVLFYNDGKLYQMACDHDMKWNPKYVNTSQIKYGASRELGYRTEEVNNHFKRACKIALYLIENNKSDLNEDDIVYLLLQE